ncbi:MAG: hypothetical protein ACYCSR_10000 [Thiomonas sp.]
MIDRLAAIADIVPPMPVAPPPPLPWWQGPWGVALLLALVLLACAGGVAAWRTRAPRRALRRLRALGTARASGAAVAPGLSAQVSAALVCARQGGVDLRHVPRACQQQIDALRYQANLDPAAWPAVIAALARALRQRAWQRAQFWRAVPPGSLPDVVLHAPGASSPPLMAEVGAASAPRQAETRSSSRWSSSSPSPKDRS